MKYRNSTILRATRLISEAFDLDDPMNGYNNISEPEMPGRDAVQGPIDLMDGETDDSQTYDVDVANPVCPCCGARLNIVDSSDDSDDEIDLGDIEAMDKDLEPSNDDSENDDAYISLDSLDIDDEEEDEDDEESEEEEEEESEDEEEEEGEKVEAF